MIPKPEGTEANKHELVQRDLKTGLGIWIVLNWMLNNLLTFDELWFPVAGYSNLKGWFDSKINLFDMWKRVIKTKHHREIFS